MEQHGSPRQRRRPAGFASLGEDITELSRLRAEAATRESEERFRAIFQYAAIGVAQVDLDGKVTLANDRYCAILGRSRGRTDGNRFSELHPPGRCGESRSSRCASC